MITCTVAMFLAMTIIWSQSHVYSSRSIGAELWGGDEHSVLVSLNDRPKALHRHRRVLDLVSQYAQKFRNREKQQNLEYERAEQQFEQRNRQYIEAVAAYQRRRAVILKRQALNLEKTRQSQKLRVKVDVNRYS